MVDRFDPNNMLKKMKSFTNAGNQQMYANTPESVIQVKIRPDESVKTSLFKPDPLIPGGYKAHPLTIQAMRTEIFVLGNDLFEDFECMYTCEKCKNELDIQFWHFCPHCGTSFPDEITTTR